MKFVKGMVAGMVISAGIAMACAECSMGSNKMMKQGKKMMKKIGIV